MHQKDVYTDTTGQIFSLCKSFAQESDGKIVLSHDNADCSSAAAALCAAAVAFSGKRSIYFKNQPQFVTRCAVKTYHASGGVHIYTNDTGSLCIAFMDKNGENSSFCGGKKVFDAEFFAGGIISMMGYKYHYTREVVKQCRNVKLGYKILVSVKNSAVRETVKSLLSELDCEYSFFMGCINKKDNASLEKFGMAIKSGEFDLGIWIDAEGETAIMADENGEIITEHEFKRLCIFAKEKSLNFISDIRCKEDAVNGFVKLLDFMKSSGKSPGEILKMMYGAKV